MMKEIKLLSTKAWKKFKRTHMNITIARYIKMKTLRISTERASMLIVRISQLTNSCQSLIVELWQSSYHSVFNFTVIRSTISRKNQLQRDNKKKSYFLMTFILFHRIATGGFLYAGNKTPYNHVVSHIRF